MTFDWQTIAVLLIIFLACLYVGRRASMRLRSLRLNRRGGASVCETGCRSCGGEQKQPRPRPAATLVQIDRSRTGTRRSAS